MTSLDLIRHLRGIALHTGDSLVFQAADRLEQLTTATEPVEGSQIARVAGKVGPDGFWEIMGIKDDSDPIPLVHKYAESNETIFWVLVPLPGIPVVPTVAAQVEEVKS
jgi:hypothetical protein